MEGVSLIIEDVAICTGSLLNEDHNQWVPGKGARQAVDEKVTGRR